MGLNVMRNWSLERTVDSEMLRMRRTWSCDQAKLSELRGDEILIHLLLIGVRLNDEVVREQC